MRAVVHGFFAGRSSLPLVVLAAALALGSVGCVERDPLTAQDVVTRPPSAPVETTCMPAPVAEPALVETSEARRPGTRLRETVSLGYAGDGKLTETPSQGGYGGGPVVGYGGYGFGGYGYGGYGYGYGGGTRRGARTVTRGGGGGGGGGGRNNSGGTTTNGGGGRGPSGGSAGGGSAGGGGTSTGTGGGGAGRGLR